MTQEHIANGVPKDCMECPVALALFDVAKQHRVLLGAFVPSISYIVLANGLNLRLPDWVSQRIAVIDDGHKVEPFVFDIEVPALEAVGA